MKKILIIFAVIILAVVVFFLISNKDQNTNNVSISTELQNQDSTQNENGEPVQNWKDIQVKDVLTDEIFSVSDFSGKPIVLESFAVWCPVCLQQQKEIAKLRDQEGDNVVYISLNTDPNEDENKVKNHAQDKGFEWIYAVSPKEMTKSLIQQFSVDIVNAPGAPVVIVCEDQTSKFLPRGVKTASELKSAIEKGC